MTDGKLIAADERDAKEKSLATASALAATTAAAELIRFAREGADWPSRFGDVEVLEQLCDAVKMVIEIDDDFSDERGQLYAAVCRFVEGWVP